MESIDHLFRREYGRLVATVTRVFGIHNLTLAEDVVQEAFCRAIEVWKFRGVPDNPSAWLMTTAKNCALDALRRERTARTYAPELGRLLDSEWTRASVIDTQFGPNVIKDDLLRMMFSCCHPRLNPEAQVALILHILCGFSVDEISSAFVSGRAATEKRITRAKKVLATSKRLFDIRASKDFSARLPSVQTALYLLFNEGYHGASPKATTRAELCQESMRLVATLLQHSQGSTPETYALGALMCFNAARLPGKVDQEGNLTALFDQDRAKWDRALLDDGFRLLSQSANGTGLSSYHVEAAIASVHALASKTEDTDWGAIVSLYNTLMSIEPSPIVALNRAIAIGQLEGPVRGLDELRTIANATRLSSYPFYVAAFGVFEMQTGRISEAREHFNKSFVLARSPMERNFLNQRWKACEAHDSDQGPLPELWEKELVAIQPEGRKRPRAAGKA